MRYRAATSGEKCAPSAWPGSSSAAALFSLHLSLPCQPPQLFSRRGEDEREKPAGPRIVPRPWRGGAPEAERARAPRGLYGWKVSFFVKGLQDEVKAGSWGEAQGTAANILFFCEGGCWGYG